MFQNILPVLWLLILPRALLATPTYLLNISVITSNKDAIAFLTEDKISEEIARLNAKFVDPSGKKIVNFQIKRINFYSEAVHSSCDLVHIFGHHHKWHPKEERNAFYNECNDPLLKDPNAIDFFFFSSDYEQDTGRYTSFAGMFKWIMVNWKRIAHEEYRLEATAHEMGHVFSLAHTLHCNATPETDSNIMASDSDFCNSGPGNRSKGFNWAQATQMRIASPLAKGQLSKNF